MPARKKQNEQKDYYSRLLNLEQISATFPKGFIKKSNSFFNKFHINRIETYRKYMLGVTEPYRKTVTDFVFITKGSFIRKKGLDTYVVKANTLYCVPAYQIQSEIKMSKNIEGFFCHFDMEIFNEGFFKQLIVSEFPFLQFVGNPVVQVPITSSKKIIYLFHQLENAYQQDDTPNLGLISSYLLTLFFELKQYSTASKQENVPASILTQRFKNALLENNNKLHTIEQFADMLGISQTYLNRCLKQTIGRTAHDLLNEMFLLESKFLLKYTSLSISEIAYKLGKKDHSDFSRFFKAQTKITPKEFRLNKG